MSRVSTGLPPLVRPTALYRAVVAVSNAADTVIDETAVPGLSDRSFISVQVQGTASAVRYARAATTSVGTDGLILNAAPAANQAGGYVADRVEVDCPYTGSVSLRAITAPVNCLIEVF